MESVLNYIKKLTIHKMNKTLITLYILLGFRIWGILSWKKEDVFIIIIFKSWNYEAWLVILI